MPQKRKMTFAKIELNVPLDDARFAVPAGATGGAPAAMADSAKAAPKDAAAVADTTKKDTKGKTSKSSAKKKG
jgi:hypothetical protein